MPKPKSVLECQDCGKVLRELGAAEAQKVADNPYNFMAFCRSCMRDQESLDIERCSDYGETHGL